MRMLIFDYLKGGHKLKDYIRDYATAAFRFYAMHDRSAEKFKERVRQEAIDKVEQRLSVGKTGASSPTEAAMMRAEEAINEKVAEICDLEAVEKTIAQLISKNRGYILEAIELVYFSEPHKDLYKCDIQDRVRVAAAGIPASERSIYYWLKQAREIFAFERGLRLKSLQ
jgi:phosphoribosyl-ATP pyrophosphohydrolase